MVCQEPPVTDWWNTEKCFAFLVSQKSLWNRRFLRDTKNLWFFSIFDFWGCCCSFVHQAVLECLEAKLPNIFKNTTCFWDTSNSLLSEPEICKANFSVHAQKFSTCAMWIGFQPVWNWWKISDILRQMPLNNGTSFLTKNHSFHWPFFPAYRKSY